MLLSADSTFQPDARTHAFAELLSTATNGAIKPRFPIIQDAIRLRTTLPWPRRASLYVTTTGYRGTKQS